MTGPIGTRTDRPVALVTDDFRLYHRLVPLFESRGVPLLGLAPGDEVPPAVLVLLGGPADDPRSLVVRDDDEATLLAVLAALDDRPAAFGGYKEVVFGVDPGKTLGLAVVAAGVALLWGEERTPRNAVDRLRRWADGLPAAHVRVHVGDGAPEVGEAVQAELERRCPDWTVRRVHEEATTPYSATTQSRHTDAAILIALRRS